MTAKPRKGAKVFAARDIINEDVFPGAQATYNIDIPKGTKGKVTSSAEEGLVLVDFGKKHGKWYLVPNLVRRTKPK